MSGQLVGSIHPTPEQFRALSALDPQTPVVMLNLLRFRENAGPDSVAAGMTGQEAYAEYGKRVGGLGDIFRGKPVLQFPGLTTVIGPADESWDEILVVRYDTLADFFLMATNEDYLAIAEWRTAAIADSRLVAFSDQSA